MKKHTGAWLQKYYKRAWAVLAIVALNLLFLLLVTQYGRSVQTVSELGVRGEEVRLLQESLAEKGYYFGRQDGVYSFSLRSAVRRFQEDAGLPISGRADNDTLRELRITEQSTADSLDFQLLARFIQWQSGDESYREQVRSGAILLNRVKSPFYPNTVSGVLLQEGAFAGAAQAILSAQPTPLAKKAAQECINGLDPSGGATNW